MQNCPNEKCGSQLPNTYRYCIYCSAKLPKTNENELDKDHIPLTLFQIGVVVSSILIGALIAVAIICF